jgi:hypothetical protein
MTSPTIVAATPTAAVACDGTTWLTFAPGPACTAVCAASASLQVLGFADGALYQTGLSTFGSSATLLKTLPAAPSAIFVNPSLPRRWTVGLDNGDLWRTFDAGLTWWPIATLSGQVHQVLETPDAQQTYVAVGTQILGLSGSLRVLEAAFPLFDFLLDLDGIFATGTAGVVLPDGSIATFGSELRSIVRLTGGTRLVAAINGSLLRQLPNGTWSSSNALAPGGINRLVVLQGRTLLVASDQFVSLTADLGNTWYGLHRGVFTDLSVAA